MSVHSSKRVPNLMVYKRENRCVLIRQSQPEIVNWPKEIDSEFFWKNLKNRFVFDHITCICSQATADCKPFRAPPNTLKRFTDSPCCALLEKPAKYYFCFVFGAIVVIFRQLLKNTCILLSFFLLIQRERGDAYCLTTYQVCNTARSCVFSMTC